MASHFRVAFKVSMHFGLISEERVKAFATRREAEAFGRDELLVSRWFKVMPGLYRNADASVRLSKWPGHVAHSPEAGR